MVVTSKVLSVPAVMKMESVLANQILKEINVTLALITTTSLMAAVLVNIYRRSLDWMNFES